MAGNSYTYSDARTRAAGLVACLALLATVVIVVAAPAAHAMPAPILVTTASDLVALDGACSLREAIETADNMVTTDCGSGNPGLDIIELPASSTITLTGALPFIDDEELRIEGNGATIDANSTGGIMIVAADLTLNDLTLTRGDAGGAPGGAIYIFDGPVVTLDSVVVTSNRASSGGGITVEGGTLRIINGSEVINNTTTSPSAGIGGGGIQLWTSSTASSALEVTDSAIVNNFSMSSGGGIYAQADATVTITDSTISSNNAQVSGGGIASEAGSNVNITDALMSANATIGGGSALYSQGTTTLVRSTLELNAGFGTIWALGPLAFTDVSVLNNVGGGPTGFAGIWSEADVTATRLVVTGDTVVVQSGSFTGTDLALTDALFAVGSGTVELTTSVFEQSPIEMFFVNAPADLTVSSSSLRTNGRAALVMAANGVATASATLQNSTVEVAGSAAGVSLAGSNSSLQLVHSTVVGGTSGGIAVADGVATIGGSIVVAPPGAQAVSLTGTGSITSGSYNIIGPTTFVAPFNATDMVGVVDAGLLPLALNDGGTTLTNDLTAGSVARDHVTGALTAGLTSPVVDQNGTGRPLDDYPDAGAYEAQEVPVAPVASDDAVSTAFDTAVTFNVVDGSAGGADTDANGDVLSVTAVAGFSNGSATFSGPNITYTPTAGFVGNDDATYTISDGNGGSDTASVSVAVAAATGTVLCDGKVVTHNMNAGASGTGTAGDDVFLGTPGADMINGLGGDDTICGEDGNDTIDGGDGVDFIYGGAGDDTMTGGLGNDRIRGQQGIDVIDGGPGNDFLYGGIDGDTINGGDGRDLIGGFGGADTLNGGPGNDRIFGGFGADLINGGSGNDNINGLIGNDVINGDDDNDQLKGDQGQDTINGGSGGDVLSGGNSLDILNGNGGDDDVSGGKSDDTLTGGPGTDTCSGNTGTDTADATCEQTFGIP